MSESSLETACRAYSYRRGCITFKLWPTVAGLPDRVFLCPGGRVLFIEFKTRRGRVSPIQRVRHLQFKAVGFPVYVIRTLAEFKTLI